MFSSKIDHRLLSYAAGARKSSFSTQTLTFIWNCLRNCVSNEYDWFRRLNDWDNECFSGNDVHIVTPSFPIYSSRTFSSVLRRFVAYPFDHLQVSIHYIRYFSRPSIRSHDRIFCLWSLTSPCIIATKKIKVKTRKMKLYDQGGQKNREPVLTSFSIAFWIRWSMTHTLECWFRFDQQTRTEKYSPVLGLISSTVYSRERKAIFALQVLFLFPFPLFIRFSEDIEFLLAKHSKNDRA